MRKPDLVVKVYLVEHGYQIEFYDKSGLRTETLRDFSDSKPVKYWIDQIELYFLKALDLLRK